MNDELTSRLSRQLHEQVDDWHSTPLTLDAVRGRVHEIRRRRRIAVAGVAAAAVAAISIPTALLGDLGRGDTAGPPIVDTPTEVVDPAPVADGPFPLTLDASSGPPPATGYLVPDDQQLVLPDATYDLPGRFVQIAPYDGGWVGIRTGDLPPFGTEVVVLDAEMRELSATRAAPSLVTTADGQRVAWVEAVGAGQDWTVVNAPVDGGQPIRTAVSAETIPEGFLAADLVAVSQSGDASGGTFYGQAGVDGLYDERSLLGYQWVTATSEVSGLVAGQTDFRGDSTCSEVRETAPGEAVVFATCDHRLGAFSPDGRWLIGYASYSDLGSPTLSILDAASGQPVVEWVSSRRQDVAATVESAAWEDADTVVAVVTQGSEQAVLRFEVDGSVTRASQPRSQEMSVEFFLPQHPFGQ